MREEYSFYMFWGKELENGGSMRKDRDKIKYGGFVWKFGDVCIRNVRWNCRNGGGLELVEMRKIFEIECKFGYYFDCNDYLLIGFKWRSDIRRVFRENEFLWLFKL